MHVNDRAVL